MPVDVEFNTENELATLKKIYTDIDEQSWRTHWEHEILLLLCGGGCFLFGLMGLLRDRAIYTGANK